MSGFITPSQLKNTAFRANADGTDVILEIPKNANIAADMVSCHASGAKADHIAIVFEKANGDLKKYSFADLEHQATCAAAYLCSLGIKRGDRIAIHSAQRPETIIAHLAIYKLGAIATTISILTGPDTMDHILADSAARVIFTTDNHWKKYRSLRQSYQHLEQVIVTGDTEDAEIAISECLNFDPGNFHPAQTGPEDPALLIYTSGSTGKAKGILHGHRILHALNASLELFYNLELREEGLVFWTGADWAWVGGLNDVVFPSLTFGHTLIVCEHRYDPDWVLGFLVRHRITHILLTPTALKRLAQIPNPLAQYNLALRTIFTGGESLPGETHRALSDEFKVACNEGYGMSEVNQMIGNCKKLRPIKPGSMGWEFPGRRVALLDDNAEEVATDEVGEIAVSTSDPTLFLEYWRQPELSKSIRLNENWIRTNDLARKDSDGYFWYLGRNDDLIKSAGYRIGPAEIEETLLQHSAVADVGIIGVPDLQGDRGMLVKACIVRSQENINSSQSNEDLAVELREFVKERLGPHKQPRLIEFSSALPTTSSGKIARSELRRQHH